MIEDGNAMWLKKNSEISDYYFYLSIFGSSTFERLLSIFAKPLLSGYDLGMIHIKDIPIPRIGGDEFRQSIIYKKLSEFGREKAMGSHNVSVIIDTIVKDLYPHETD